MKKIIFIIFSVLLLTRCEDKIEHNPPTMATGKEIQVELKCSIANLIAGDETTKTVAAERKGTPATRVIPADMESGGIYEDKDPIIQNIWIIQFDGNTPDAKMVGAPRYLSVEDEDLILIDPQNPSSPLNISVPLVEVKTECYTLFVANIREGLQYNWNLGSESTFADVITRTKTIQFESGTYEDFTTLDSIGSRTLLMSAVTKSVVTLGTPLVVDFKRNVAKVTLNLTLDNGEMSIRSVRMRNVSNSIVYADAALEANGITNTTVFPVNFLPLDYSGITNSVHLPNSENPLKTYSWYVPRNQQGKSSLSTSAKQKTFFAPTNATFIEIIAQKGSDLTCIIRIYPGAEMINDYNLLADHEYTINLTVKDVGSNDDSRVQSISHLVDYSGNGSLGSMSNSFIINPAPVESGVHRTYRIGVQQVSRYWGGTADGYGNVDKNTIEEGEPWQVFLIWSDLPTLVSTDQSSSTAITLKNNNSTTIPGGGVGPNHAFELNVPPGLPAGNFLIGIKKTGAGSEDKILWSWHFWVTDYTPDYFNRTLIKQNTYTYTVPGGQVERYGSSAIGDFWSEGGIYKDRVMMDRNLGAVENFFSVYLNNLSIRGLLFYQFGRKDPLPGSVITAYNNFFTPSSSYGVPEGGNTSTSIAISESVSKPWVYYLSPANWSSQATDPNYLWNDPNTKTFSDPKSIYDPCPPGWRMPINGTWNDFSRRDNPSSPYITTVNPLRDLGWTTGRGIGSGEITPYGARYWPGTTVNDPVQGRIWYPAIGSRRTANAGLNGPGGVVFYISASASSVTHAYALNGGQTDIRPSYSSHRGVGYSVRCIADKQ